jgi:NADPH:quinone reductase-like Zn-dependent oxidoreductase
MTGLAIVDALAPLDNKTVLIVGAAGGVGSFATQFAANAGAHVIANARVDNATRMSAYGAATASRWNRSQPSSLVRTAHCSTARP